VSSQTRNARIERADASASSAKSLREFLLQASGRELRWIKVFMKQLGRKPVFEGRELVILDTEGEPDRKGTTPAYWPKRFKPLAVRQFPALG
jgi:hypothetical protein